ncbi:MAG TPA: hypothetical protein DDW50_20420 [Firmicutes bacterium]|nr:hypothetical protein [Bacillota bacterium]
MFLTVPWHQIKRFALFGVISGLGTAIALLLVMQNWLGVWIYQKVDFLYIGRIPLILSAAWTPAEIFFAHFLSRYQRPLLRLLLIFFIPAVAVSIHFIQIWNQMLIYHHWNYLGTYLVSLGIHWGIALYLHRVYKIPVLS